MVTVRFYADDLKALADPRLIAQAEAELIESAVDVLVPFARDEAPSKTGRGRGMILGATARRAGHVIGRVHAGKAYWLRILATGAEAHEITPFRYALTRRGRLKRQARQALRAQGPGRARGAIRALRLRFGAGILFRARARHPGLRPDAWMERAARRGEGPVGAAGERVIERALNERIGA